MFNSAVHAKIYSVSELNAEIKAILEQRFPFVWISGEISNLSVPSSGHFYFTLKDEKAQIRTVMFRGQNRNLKFAPEDGMSVTGMGRVSVYEPRGTYQIIIEHLEPRGVGALQVAFEQLKKRLSAEGLFADQVKKPLPFLPQKIHLVTSPTGAVVHDMLHVIARRYPNLPIDIIPVKVQGVGAVEEITAGIALLNLRSDAQVAILARGGGTMEDLQAFNTETVARAIFASKVPIISAVGHETDFTIADFVADLRAPTPSAAAELVVPLKSDLYRKTAEFKQVIINLLNRRIEQSRRTLTGLSKRLIDPQKKIIDSRLRLDDQAGRLQRTLINLVNHRRERLGWQIDKLYYNNPIYYIDKSRQQLDRNTALLNQKFSGYISTRHLKLREYTARLNALSPTAILDRGYSITRTIPEAAIIRAAGSVQIGEDVEVVLAKGSLKCSVKEKKTNA
jgi:exodeoxyribonuclease VII large subunit